MQLCDRAKNAMNRERRGLKEDVDVEINEKKFKVLMWKASLEEDGREVHFR